MYRVACQVSELERTRLHSLEGCVFFDYAFDSVCKSFKPFGSIDVIIAYCKTLVCVIRRLTRAVTLHPYLFAEFFVQSGSNRIFKPGPFRAPVIPRTLKLPAVQHSSDAGLHFPGQLAQHVVH